MNFYRYSLVAVVFVAMTMNASAFPLSKKTKIDPLKRLPELIVQARSDPDERKRVSAVEELRQFDAQQFPDLVPILIEVLKTDTKTGVRMEAVHSLNKLRPTSQEARQALDMAASKDSSLRVRMQARTALLFYSVSAPKKTEPQGPVLIPAQPTSPPVITNRPAAPVTRPGTPTPKVITAPQNTKEPPLARPQPQDTAPPPLLLPTNPPRLETPPPAEGPVLIPRQ